MKSGWVSTQFDADESARRRDDAIDAVERGAPVDFKSAALECVLLLAKNRKEFTTDAVWYLLGKGGVQSPPEPRAMGAIMRIAASNGWVEATDRTALSVRTPCHRRPIRVWESKIGERS